ncbi:MULTISPECIES: glycosyltransferase family 2 protein [Eubacteriales]|uniref:Glycosyl transferase family 2 n=1 Tax=Bittarella massiliensis (ex Durand et al. 2017) TaxID=1720313 RepID=A0AAQ1MDJ7_9FIRM|nr:MULTISPECIES: glycosyltransferase family 2 protein [Eubacteriales]ERJ00309.1 glycosyltransferase, group 2 family protein [Clostridium sp. ATCC 29733]MZL70658.1 glycosyltransferase [Bittarella massiliensis (ex Durand et al. 2017)]MZL81344.1 glycosyltransferase [Bittarella massiliensis (ex Durand et al. 2017)]SHG05077.1 Glycosyl transferase family 2 [Bittarella massiliensis (ex Durand et al. 2017)]
MTDLIEQRETGSQADPAIEVSVVVPILNEEAYIGPCIESILKQDFPRERMEVLFVDGDSEDKTTAIIAQYQEKYPFIHCLHNPGRTVQLALNIGIRAAVGEYIVRLDAHSEYADDYISQSIATLKKTGADNVGGPMIACGKNAVQKVVAAAYHSPFALGGGKFHIADYEGYVDTVFLGAYKRQTILDLGLYDEDFPRSEDDEFNMRLHAHGGKVYMTPAIKSRYYPRDSYRKVFKQYYEYGVWKVAVIKKHKKPARLSHLVPISFVLFIAVFGLLSLFFSPARWVFGGVMGLYLLLDIYFSFSNKRVKGFVNKLRLMWVHFILHISYGLGFLQGIFQFAGKTFQPV